MAYATWLVRRQEEPERVFQVTTESPDRNECHRELLSKGLVPPFDYELLAEMYPTAVKELFNGA